MLAFHHALPADWWSCVMLSSSNVGREQPMRALIYSGAADQIAQAAVPLEARRASDLVWRHVGKPLSRTHTAVAYVTVLARHAALTVTVELDSA